MATSHTTLDAAAASRKARLAELRSLKRKQPPTDESSISLENDTLDSKSPASEQTPDVANLYLSGRNYDPVARGPKLGFDTAPNSELPTVEETARKLVEEQKLKEEEEAKRNGGDIDLFALQPKKRDWDLKRELRRRTEILDVRTDNAVARLVRERLAKKADGDSEGEGLEGSTLVEGIKAREREDERDRQADDDYS